VQAHVLEAIVAGPERGRRQGRPLPAPFDRPIRTDAGDLVVAVDGEEQLGRLAALCGVGQAPDRARAIVRRLGCGRADDWAARLAQHGIPALTPRTDVGALPEDPVVGGLLHQLEAGCWVPASPWTFG
jgi:hypothetical protein